MASTPPSTISSGARFHTPLQSHKRPRDDDGDEDEQRAPPAQRWTAPRRVYLHRHALESIFAFLPLSGLATALAVSRDWQAAVGAMRSIHCQLNDSSGDPFPRMLSQVAASRMRRHVTGVTLRSVTSRILAFLHSRMPHLTRLVSSHLKIAAGVTSLLLPPRLHTLMLVDPHQYFYMDTRTASVLLNCIGQLSQLRELELEVDHDGTLSFTPLASLPMLRVLRLNRSGRFCFFFSDAQVDQFRALVTDLEVCEIPMRSSNVMRLLRQPHALHWQSIAPLPSANDSLCALLPGLSCLTELDAKCMLCSDFDWLSRMHSLTQLSIGLSYGHSAASAATQSLVSALQHCPRITSLSLHAMFMPITSELLTACLSGMPALSTLEIHRATLPSLSFLAVSSLALSLRELRLLSPWEPRPDVSELHHLHGLTSLRELGLQCALSEPLEDERRSVLRAHLPHLNIRHENRW